MMFGGTMHGFGIAGWFVGLLGFVLLIGLIVGVIILIVWAVRQAQRNQTATDEHQRQSTPESILKARYARGEISRDEYLAMLADLKE
ncbi:MAG: SHOCT domain-containing protein [Anaerolineales bacterium]|jgi:putative membrane protein